MKNIYVFTWEEKYSLDKEVLRWKENFAQKFGKDAIFVFDNQNFDAERVLEAVFGGGLFSQKKFVIIYWLPIDTDSGNKLLLKQTEFFLDIFLEREGEIPEDVLLMFVSYQPDKRLKLYKFLQKVAEIKIFSLLNSVQINLFIKEQLKDLQIDSTVVEYFLLKVWKDLYRVVHELEKLCLRCQVHSIPKITLEMIDQVVFGQVEINAFLFFDHVLTNPSEAIIILDKMHQDWTDFNQALGMLYWGLKLYLFLADAYQHGIRDRKVLAQTLKYHPFAINKNMKHIDTILDKKLAIRSFYCQLVELDYHIKIGQIPVFGFWLELKKMVIRTIGL